METGNFYFFGEILLIVIYDTALNYMSRKMLKLMVLSANYATG